MIDKTNEVRRPGGLVSVGGKPQDPTPPYITLPYPTLPYPALPYPTLTKSRRNICWQVCEGASATRVGELM